MSVTAAATAATTSAPVPADHPKDSLEQSTAPSTSQDSQTEQSSTSNGADGKRPAKQFSGRPNPIREGFRVKMDKIKYEIENINAKMNDIQSNIETVSLGLPSAGKRSNTASGDQQTSTAGPTTGRDLVGEIREKKGQLSTLIESCTKATQALTQFQQENERKIKQVAEMKFSKQTVDELERKLEAGNLKLVDERKIISEISKHRKSLGANSSLVQEIEALEASMNSLRSTRESNTAKITVLKKEIAEIQSNLKETEGQKQERKERLKVLFDERNTLKAKRDALYEEKRAVHQALEKAMAEQQAMYERNKQRSLIYTKKREIEDQIEVLEEKISKLDLSVDQEVADCEGLIVTLKALFSGSSKPTTTVATAPSVASSNGPKECERKVEMPSDLVPISRPNDEVMFVKTQKQSKTQAKSGKKSSAEPSSSTSAFRLPINIVAGLGAIGVPLPTNAAAIPNSIEQLEQKRNELASKSEERKASVEKQKTQIRTEIGSLQDKIKEMEADISKSRA